MASRFKSVLARLAILAAAASVVPACKEDPDPPGPLTIVTGTLPNAAAGVGYSQTLLAANGTPPYTWALLAGSLPGTMTLDGASGTISGTAPANAFSSFTVRVTDSVLMTAVKTLSITVAGGGAGPVTISTGSLSDATQNALYGAGLSATGGLPPYTWSVTVGALPTGVTLDPATGLIGGVPTALGTSNFTVQVADGTAGTPQTDTQALSITVNAPVSIVTTTLPAGTQDASYAQTIASSGGVGPFTWSVVGGSLPAGITLNAATGGLSGTPTAAATSNFTVRVIDANQGQATQSLAVTINTSLSVVAAALPAWTINRPYPPQSIAGSGGTAPYTNWAVTAGGLPGGLGLNPSTGAITGTPTATGTFNFTVQITDTAGALASQGFSILVNDPPTVATLSLPASTVNRPYNQAVARTGGTAPFSWSLTGSLPTGVTQNTGTGALSGTPTGTGLANFTVQVTDAAGATASQALSILINLAPIVQTLSLPSWTQGIDYSQVLQVGEGTAPFTWSITGALPTGLTLNNSTGEISGTPTGTGTANFTAQATDAAGAMASQALSITINASIAVSTASLPGGSQGVAYNQTLASSGGTAPRSWSLTGSLPAGLSLNPATGAITGTPTGAGTSNFTVQVTDNAGDSDSKALSIAITSSAPIITTEALPSGTVGVAYNALVSGAGGVGPYTWSPTVALPGWMTLDPATGRLTGVPVAMGPVTLQITLTDSSSPSPQTTNKSYNVMFNDPENPQGNFSVSTLRLPDGVAGSPYTGNVYFNGGVMPVSFFLNPRGNPLPANLNLSPGGVVSGTLAAGTEGHYTFTVDLTDSDPAGAKKCKGNVLLVVRPSAPPALDISTSSLPSGTMGVVYTPIQLVATGGEPPYLWDLAEGSEPPLGMMFTPTGLLYGLPVIRGAYNLKVRVRDNAKPRGLVTKILSVTLAPAPSGFQVTTTSLPDAQVGVAYGPQSIATNGVNGPVTAWITEDSDMRAIGLSFNTATGQVSGTPTASGDVSFIAGATNSDSPRKTAIAGVLFQVATPAFGITTRRLPDFEPGVPYAQLLLVQGSTGSVTWSLFSGQLPPGLSLDPATGLISGTSTSFGGGDRLIFQATDSSGSTRGLVHFDVRRPDPRVPSSQGSNPPFATVLPFGIVGSAYSQFLTAEPVQLDWTELHWMPGQAAPSGLSLDAVHRRLAGTPTVPGRYTLSLRIREISSNGGMSELPVALFEDTVLLEIHQTAGFRISERLLHGGREGVAYNTETLHVSSPPGAGPYTYALTAGALPPGMALDPDNGTMTGTPSRAGIYRFTVQASQGGSNASMVYELPIDPKLPFGVESRRLPDALKTVAYSAALTAYGAAGPVTWTDAGSPVTFASLGLTLSASGAISGIPSASLADGFYEVAVTATQGPNTSVRKVSVLIEAVPIFFSRLGDLGFATRAYADAVTAVGGTAPYTYALVPGMSLPRGLALSGAGGITGTPEVVGGYEGTLFLITDADGRTGYGRLGLVVISNDLPALGWAALILDWVNADVDDPLTQDYDARGGTPNYAFSTAPVPPSGANDLIPPGISLSTVAGSPNKARFSGTPTVSGDFNYTLRVTDAAAATSDFLVRFRVEGAFPKPTVNTRRVPTGSASVIYPATRLSAYPGGSAPSVDWSSSNLPAGLTLSAGGELSGTGLMSAGIYYFVVRVTDTTDVTNFGEGRIKLVIAP